MSRNQKSSRVFVSRFALFAIIGGMLLSFAGAATNAANFSLVASIQEYFAGGTANAVVTQTAPAVPTAAISLASFGVPYTQNFDTLPASGSATWTNDLTIPGWFHARTGTGTTVVANDGSSNAGNLYSYGTGTATDRALGSLGSGNAAIGNLFWGAQLVNNTGGTITSLDVSYTGEQWRNSAAAAQTIAFSYLVGSPTVTGSLAEFQSAGVVVTSLDFTGPITGGAAGALNGNLAANRATVTFTIPGLSIPDGTQVMLRWSDPDHTGADHGLSIDDFSVSAGGAPPAVPEMDVLGNGQGIADGDAFPIATDGTDFGSTSTAGGTVSHVFTIQNLGNGNLNLTGNPKVAVSGDNASEFTVTVQPASPVGPLAPQPPGLEIDAPNQTTFTVVFDPSAAGLRTATLSIANDDSTENPYDFAIQGTGTAPEIDVRGNGNSITNNDMSPSLTDGTDFGSVDVGMGAEQNFFTIVNTGNADLILTGILPPESVQHVFIVGPHAADFEVTQFPISPVPAGSPGTEFAITFNPSAAGTRTATVRIPNNDADEGIYDFAIQGNGTAPTATPTASPTATPFPPGVYVVNTTDDSIIMVTGTEIGGPVTCTPEPGGCTLREAIDDANNNNGGVISFDIPANDLGHVYYANNGGPGVSLAQITATTAATDAAIANIDPDWPHSWWRIQPTSPMPELVESIDINGYTQRPCSAPNPSPCSSANTSWAGNNANLLIEVNGQGLLLGRQVEGRDADIFTIQQNFETQLDGLLTESSTIRGLVINGGPDSGVLIYSNVVRPEGISPEGFDGSNVNGNYIGTDVSGTLAIPNGVGVSVEAAFGNLIGGTNQAEQNVISGNDATGVAIYTILASGEASFNLVQGNIIGTNRSGTAALGNGGGNNRPEFVPEGFFSGSGVQIFDAGNNTIGPNDILKRNENAGRRRNSERPARSTNVPEVLSQGGNLISGNFGDGVNLTTVFLFDARPEGEIAGNNVYGNLIGTNIAGTGQIPNSGSGVGIYSSPNNNIGGGDTTPAVLGNVIAYNAGSGVLVEDVPIFRPEGFVGAAVNNEIFGNSIHSNTGLGIDLAVGITPRPAPEVGDGVTPNDSTDEDEGPNNLQNFPVITTANAGTSTVAGTLNSTPMAPGFNIDLYMSPTCNTGPQYGEGQTYIGFITTGATNASGNVSFTQNTFSSLVPGQVLTATASNFSGDTSEFSQCFTITGQAQADLSITKTASATQVNAGSQITYTITASNAGPAGVTGAIVTDNFAAVLTGATWTCTGTGGGTCPASGSGNINAVVNLPAGASVIFTATATVSASGVGPLTNTATVAPPVTVGDPVSANNSAVNSAVTIIGQADLAITKTDGITNFTAPGQTTYTIVVTNNGPQPAVNALVTDNFPSGVTVDNWTCLPQNQAHCTLAGAGNINQLVYIPVGGILTYTATATVAANQVGQLINTATVTAPPTVFDPNTLNNSSTDTDNFVVSISGNVKQYVPAGNTNLAGVTMAASCSMVVAPAPEGSLLTTTTNASGNFTFANIPSGSSCTITPSMSGKVFDPTSRTVTAATANVTGVNFIAYDTAGIPRNIHVLNTHATPGNAVTVPIRMASHGTEKVMTFSIDYPIGVLHTPVVACGASTGGCAVAANTATLGKVGVSITAAGAGVAAGLREIATVTFQTNVGFAPPNAALDFSTTPTAQSVRDVANNELQKTFTNGFVVFVDGMESDVAGRNTGNGDVLSTDVTQVRRFVVGTDTVNLSFNEFQRTDAAPLATFGDGVLGPGDVIQAKRYSSRLDALRAAAGPAGPPPPPLGVVAAAPIEEFGETTRVIRTETVKADPGQSVTVGVDLESNGDEIAASFTLEYDATRLRNARVTLADDAPEGAVLTVNTDDIASGRIGILVDAPQVLTRDSAARRLINVTFDVAANAAGGEARIRFTDGLAMRGVSNDLGNTLDARYADGAVTISGPEAVGFDLTGRVTTPDGRGLKGAQVTVIDDNGQARTVTTSAFGYYRFEGLAPSETYTVGITTSRYRFAAKAITRDTMSDVDFVANE